MVVCGYMNAEIAGKEPGRVGGQEPREAHRLIGEMAGEEALRLMLAQPCNALSKLNLTVAPRVVEDKVKV